jgi:hypothetical protein
METLARAANRGSVSTVSREPEGYSCRFDTASSQKMQFAASSSVTGERRTNTVSFWIKRANLSTTEYVWEWGTSNDNSNRQFIRFQSGDNKMRWGWASGIIGDTDNAMIDQSAWTHVVLSSDTSPSTPVFKCWLNGLLNYTNDGGRNQNDSTGFGSTENQTLGWSDADDTGYFSGYLAEFHGVGGVALLPTAFGAFDGTGTWKPIEYTGTSGTGSTSHGTNGFYLNFDDASDLGADSSGNGNDFTTSNMDTTNQTGDGPKNNFAVMNPLSAHASLTHTEGNLKASYAGSNDTRSFGSITASSGKWYWEIKGISPNLGDPGTQRWGAGVAESNNAHAYNDKAAGDGPYEVGLYVHNGTINTNEVVLTTFSDASFTQNDIMMLACDIDNLKMYWGKNGTWLNSGDPTSGATGTGAIALTASWSPFIPIFAEGNTNSQIWQVNFGNPTFSITSGYSDGNDYGLFKYEPPTGFYAWNTKNLAQYG